MRINMAFRKVKKTKMAVNSEIKRFSVDPIN